MLRLQNLGPIMRLIKTDCRYEAGLTEDLLFQKEYPKRPAPNCLLQAHTRSSAETGGLLKIAAFS